MARGSSARDVAQSLTQTLAWHHGNARAPFVLSHQSALVLRSASYCVVNAGKLYWDQKHSR